MNASRVLSKIKIVEVESPYVFKIENVSKIVVHKNQTRKIMIFFSSLKNNLCINSTNL